MTVLEAICEVRRFGSIWEHDGALKVRFREPDRTILNPAIDILRLNKDAAIQTLAGFDTDPSKTIPPLMRWPESLLDLASELGGRSGDSDAARREVWLGWCEWKAAALNRLFQEQGVTGRPGRITAATVRHGEEISPQQ